MDLYQWLTLLIGGGIISGILKLVFIGAEVKTTVDLIITNHLPHLTSEVVELRRIFIDHVEDDAQNQRLAMAEYKKAEAYRGSH